MQQVRDDCFFFYESSCSAAAYHFTSNLKSASGQPDAQMEKQVAEKKIVYLFLLCNLSTKCVQRDFYVGLKYTT